MNQLKSQNPQGYQMLMQAKNSGANPQELLKQFMGNTTPEQMEQVLKLGKQFNIPDDVLSQIQNMR